MKNPCSSKTVAPPARRHHLFGLCLLASALSLLSLPPANAPLRAQNIVNVPGDYIVSDGATLTLGTAAPANVTYAPGDLINLTGTTANTTNTIDLGATAANIGGLFASGHQTFLVTAAGAGFNTTGKLILGAQAASLTSFPYTAFNGVLDFTGITGANTFAGGIDLNTGALRIRTLAQLGAPLSLVNFTGATPAASGTLIIATGANILADSASGTTNRLNLANNTAATIALEPSSTLTLSKNIPGANGGAIALNNGASLSITAASAAQVIFTSNTTNPSGNSTNYDGGAIFVGSGATLTLTGSMAGGGGGEIIFSNNYARNRGGAIFVNTGNVFIDSATFFANSSTAGHGGAIAALQKSNLTLSNVVFISNSNANSGGVGGAIFNNTNVLTTLQSATFINNVAANAATSYGGAIGITGTSTLVATDVYFSGNRSTTQGGAIAVQTAGSRITLTGAIFISNTSGQGGAISVADSSNFATITSATFLYNTATGAGGAIFTNGTNSSISLADVLFAGNTAGANGGAIVYNINVPATFSMTNVSFLDNKAGGAGGAVSFFGNLTGTYAVTTSATIAGNTAFAGSATAASSGVYFSNGGSPKITLAISDTAHLDMLDPMTGKIANNSTIVLTKTGAGAWNLGGNTLFSVNNTGAPAGVIINFIINEGTLHLYRAGETSGAYAAATGNLALDPLCTSGTLALNGLSTLSAGGGNTITIPVITLSGSSTIALDLAAAPTAAANPAYSILTLNATTLLAANNWTQTLNLLNVPAPATLAQGTTFNLITLTGTTFNTIDNFITLGLPAGDYTLQLAPGNSSILQLYYGVIPLHNNILTWTGGAPAGPNWSAPNWSLTTNLSTTSTYAKGDIINLEATPAPAPAATVLINTDTAITIAGLYASGPASYTITGANPITITATTGMFSGSPAATGQLILGAKATDAATLDQTPSAAYTGTLTLSNTYNNITAGITINTGALVGNALTLATGTAGIHIAAPGSLTFDQPAAATYTAPITGQGLLIKTNTATLTLAADNSAFTGTTSINQGALLLSGSPTGSAGILPAKLGGAINVAPNATLAGGNAATAANVTLAPGATLQVGIGATGSQTFNILGNLTLLNGSLLDYTNLANTLAIAGPATLTGTSTLNLPATSSGSFSLITAASFAGAFTTDLATSLLVTDKGTLLAPTDYHFTLDTTAGQLWLIFDTVHLATNNILAWTGATPDHLWLTSTNWTTLGVTTTFAQGDIVNLTDSTNNPAVPPTSTFTLNLNSSATATAIYLSGTTNYTITDAPGAATHGALVTATGLGILTGTAANGKLTLGKTAATDPAGAAASTLAAFTGTLDLTTLTGTNNFTAGIEINTGALRAATTPQLGATLAQLQITGTGKLIAAGNMLFDSASGSANRFTLAPAATATFILEDSATMTLSNNAATAIAVSPGATLTLQAGANSQYKFLSNKAGVTANDGGAITGTNNVTITLAANPAGGAFLFDSNTGARGSAIFILGTSSLYVDHATFTNNNGTGNGGVLAIATYSTATLSNVLFANNRGNSGVILDNTSSNLLIQSATLASNYASGNSGAISVQGSSTLTLRDVLFTSNTSANGGGAIYLSSGTCPLTMTDVSFLNNITGSNGGALALANNTLAIAYTISPGSTSRIAGNLAGSLTTGTANGIYFGANTGLSLAIDTGAGGTLDMLDPMTAANATLSITKTGPGAWNLGGANNLGATTAAAITLAINTGTLRLYHAGEQSAGYTAAAARLNITGGSFTLAAPATLHAGGGNAITAPSITLAPASTLILDLAATSPNATPVLALNSALYNTAAWTQNLTLLNLATLGAANGDTFNLITLAGAGATTSLFTPASFNNLAPAGLLAGYTLQLANSGSTLQLLYTNANFTNNVLTWTGSAGDTLWRGANWLATGAGGAPATYSRGDIVNLAATPATTTITIEAAGANIAGMYASGPASYTITGGTLASTATAGTLTGPAATGKLILGARANDATAGAATLDTTPAAAYTGTLTLANAANNFAGGIEIRSGALSANAANLAPTTAGITIAAPGTLILDQPTAATYSAPITGAGTLIKTNAGALTLTANNSSYAGTTNINAGALQLINTGAALGGAININNGARLVGASAATAGSTGATLTLANGATLQIGTGTAAGQTFTIAGNLALSPGSLLDYTNAANTLLLAGALAINGPGTINLGLLSTGSYTLINATAPGGTLAGLNTTLLDITYKGTLLTPGSNYTLTTANNLLTLTILTMPLGLNNVLNWTNAAGDNAWLASPNWNVAGTTLTKPFAQGDIVNLSGAGSPLALQPFSLSVLSPITVSALYLSGTTSYTLTGPAGITADPASGGDLAGTPAATGKLVLGQQAITTGTPATAAFTGTLDLTALAGPNNFTAGVNIITGALRVSTTAQLGAPLARLNITGTGTLIAAGSMTFDSASGTTNHLVIPSGAAATFLIEDGVTLTLANNKLTTVGGAIAVNANASLALTTGSGAQCQFNNNNVTSDGGAISVIGVNSKLVLDGAAGAAGGILFNTNTITARGGAIFANTGVVLVYSGSFAGNMTNSNGGAVGAVNGARIELWNSVFTSNTAYTGGALFANTNVTTLVQSGTFTGNIGYNAGVISVQGTSATTVRDSTFTGNYAANNGGVIVVQTNGSKVDVARALFDSNTAANGGAINTQNTVTGTFASVTFTNNTATGATTGGGAINNNGAATLTFAGATFERNTAAGSAANGGAIYTNGANALLIIADTLLRANTASANGGAIAFGANSPSTLSMSDVSFLDNTAGALGGAIYSYGTVVTSYNVLTSATIAGNKASGARNGLYFGPAGSPNVFLAVIDGAHLDMLDPMGAALANSSTLTITKNGYGLWNLGGSTNLAPSDAAPASTAASILVTTGTLHLYRAGETSGAYTAATANITISPNFTTGTFALLNDSALTAGGPNTITAPVITISPTATLSLDLLAAAPDSPAILTLNASTTLDPANWTQTLDLANLSSLPVRTGDVFNLLTLTGSAATANPLTPASFNNLSLPGLPAHYTLDLTADNLTLQLTYFTGNNVLTWTGATPAANWRGTNWAAGGTNSNYAKGDIINLSNIATPAPPVITINIDTTTSATLAGLYLSGTQNYTLTGSAIVANATATTLSGTPAATGKLILGAKATDDGGTLDTTPASAYTGTLTLANAANTFTAGIDILGGALVGNAATLGSATPGITIAPAATLTFDQPTTAAYSSPLRGTGTLVKTNTATLTLTANNSAFTGSTEVAQGALLLGSSGSPADAPAPGSAAILAALGGQVQVAAGATFGGTGTAGAVTLATAATLQLGTGNSEPGTLSLASLTLAPATTLNYTTPTATLHLATPLTAPAGPVTINLATLQTGAYTTNLGNIAPLNTATLTIDGITHAPDARQHASLSTDTNGNLLLTAVVDISRILTWTGATSGTWAFDGANWKATDNSPTNLFGIGDRVIFDDTAPATAPRTIAIAATGAPVSDVIVNTTANYTFTGGPITASATSLLTGSGATLPGASGKLTKTGPGALTLANTANTFTGGIEIDAGTLTFATIAQLGGDNNNPGILFTGGQLATPTPDLTLTVPITVAPAATGTLNPGPNNISLASTLSITTATSSGTLAKTGPGALTLTPATTTPSGTNFVLAINEGTVRTTNSLSYAGTLDLARDTSLIAPLGSTGTIAAIRAAAGSTLRLDLIATLNTGNLQLADSSTLTTTSLGTIVGNFQLNGMVAADIASGNTLTLVALSTHNNTITGTGAFQKTGAGTLELRGMGALMNTGVTQINAGTVLLDGVTRTGTAPLPINSGMLLNSGTLALSHGTGTASLTNDNNAADWTGLRIIQSPDPAKAASSVITGAYNEIVHLDAASAATASGTFLPLLTGALHVAIDAGNDTISLGNTANNFTGLIIAASGTLKITDLAPLGPMPPAATTAKIALNGGAVEFSTPAPFNAALELRALGGIVTVDDGLSLSLPNINKASSATLATLTKAGSGTLTLANFQGTGLVVADGRCIATTTNSLPKSNGLIDVRDGATYQLSRALSGASGTSGFFAGDFFVPSFSGTVTNSITGSGTLEITDSQQVFTGARTDIARINISGAATTVAIATNAFSPQGTITVDSSRLILAFGTQTLGNVTLKNGATLGFIMSGSTTGSGTNARYVPVGIPGRSATLASLSSDDGSAAGPAKLWFNADIAKGYADHLTINTPAAGAFAINVINYGTAPAQTSTALELIRAPASPAATFTIATPELDSGLYKYTVSAAAPAPGIFTVVITGSGAMSNTAAAINAAAAALPLAWFAEMDSVAQRLGELHLDTRDRKAGLSAWMRGYDEKLNFNTKLTGAAFAQTNLGGEAGVDGKVGDIDTALYFGAFAGYGQSRRARAADITDATSDSSYGGLYATLAAKNGWYVDLAGKLNRFKNNFTAIAPVTGAATAAAYKNLAFGGSLEIGKHMEAPADWFIEPQAQCAFAKLTAVSYTTSDGCTVSQLAGAVGRARAGFRFGRDIETGSRGTLSLYIKAYYGCQWTHGGQMNIFTPDGQAARYAPTIKGCNIEAGAGLAWLIARSTQIYFDYDTTQADYYIKPYGLNLGVRYLW